MIELIELSKNYNYVELFHKINITFEDGKAYGLVGRNGSGKSVLLRLIAGFSRSDDGRVIIDGKTLGKDLDFIQEAGISINQPDFMPGWTGYDSLMYLREIRKRVTEEELLTWVARLGMTEAIHRKYKTYSQGMKQKMRIIQALMENPRYLIMDEPFNALDEQSVAIVQEIFLEFKGEDKTIIFTSHHDQDIQAIADEIISIEELKARGKSNESH